MPAPRRGRLPDPERNRKPAPQRGRPADRRIAARRANARLAAPCGGEHSAAALPPQPAASTERAS